MIHFKNAKMHTIREGASIVLCFTDDEGRDWYDTYRGFWRSTVRLVYTPDTGYINAICYGTQPALFEGVSVIELEPKDVPPDFKMGEYLFKDGTFIKQE